MATGKPRRATDNSIRPKAHAGHVEGLRGFVCPGTATEPVRNEALCLAQFADTGAPAAPVFDARGLGVPELFPLFFLALHFLS